MNFNERLRQVVFLLLIIALGIVLFIQLQFILPAILGAITLYILNRKRYFRTVFEKKWPPFWTAVLFTLLNGILLLLPFGVLFTILTPKLQAINPTELYIGIQEMVRQLSEKTGIQLSNLNALQNLPAMISKIAPKVLGTAGSGLVNTGIMFFILFFLLYNGSRLEHNLGNYIPLKKENLHRITSETKGIVTSYAVGIPVLSISQGIAAYIGYIIFGIDEALLWSFATAVCAVLPVVGSGIIIIPLVVYLFATNHTGNAIGLMLYGGIVVTNIDNVLRLFLIKAIADIHPLITLFGIIVGLQLFGFIGLIFGPLLISYFLLMIKIYTAEFKPEEENGSGG